jgi:hypothetical protein|tara:strand:- start:47 stop:373 length:327 start_codon:yes stop_codon:yes gene_type:complete
VSKRLIDIDPWTKTKTFHHYDHSTETTYIEDVQDVELTLKQAKQMRDDSAYKARGIKEDYYHYARIPNAVLVELMQKYHLDWRNNDDMKKIEQVIARDYKYCLTVNKI